jgi:[acyl-carrier-protein] S-malonyltransferase
MSARLLLLCPGQGGQHAGMFDLARTDGEAAAFLDHCALVLDPATMFENQMAQPLVVAATLAMWVALGSRIPAPALVAGYSAGELAGYAVAGAIAPLACVELTRQRAALMDTAARAHPGQALAALSALPVERARQAAREAGFEISIVTGEDSCILGGPAANLEALNAAVTGLGARLQRVPVTVASHTSLLAGAVEPFRRVLEAAHFAAPNSPVLAGIDATRVQERAAAIDTLSRQLAEPILWSACMDVAAEAGITVALELGPGAALSRMLQARHPHIACRSAADFRSIDGSLGWLGQQLD